jgi:hypothetical protein
MPRPAFQNQRNQLAPFSYAQASGPELPSLIGSINQQYDSQNAAMDMQSKMADHDQKMQLQSWQMENSDAYGQLLTELDPSSPDFDQQLSQIDRRAFTLPGFDKVLGAKVRERDASNATEQRRLTNIDRTRTDRLNMIKGAPSAMQFDMQDAINAGDEEGQRAIGIAWDDLQKQRLATTAAAARAEDEREEDVAAKAKEKSVKVSRSAEDRKSIRDLKMAILKEEGVLDGNEAHDKTIKKGSKVTAKGTSKTKLNGLKTLLAEAEAKGGTAPTTRAGTKRGFFDNQ